MKRIRLNFFMLFDTHCHLQFQAFKEDRDDAIARSLARGMILNVVGTQKDTSRAAVALAETYDGMYATIGTHPIHLFPTHVDEEETSFQSREEDFDEAYYETLARSKKVVAVGETGIDLYHLPKDKPKEDVLAKQRDVFLKHAAFAQKHNLALVIHCRDAHDELIQTLKSTVNGQLSMLIRGVVHCFSSNWTHAEQYLDLGLYLGFTGVITFPAKKTNPQVQENLLEVVRRMPLDRILVETDSPYLAPQAYRGKRCEPWMVEETVKKIAEICGVSPAKIEEQTTNNARALFLKGE
ncbi:MAG TPA: hypothetical protein DCY48_02520 [Candidatus Magasanikbacteria bacterium]|nr:hypothetical protein [Candidatus Magasanikbacteria bacterium]